MHSTAVHVPSVARSRASHWSVRPLAIIALTLLLAGCAARPSAQAPAAPPPSAADSLEAESQALRMARDWSGSLDVAQTFVRCLEADPEAPRWRLLDARRNHDFLAGMIAAPESLRRKLEVGDSLDVLFVDCYEREVYDSAATLARLELPLVLAACGDSSYEAARAYNNVAVTVMELGDYDEAIRAAEAALAINRKELDPLHPAIDAALNNLATLYEDVGKLAEAEALYRESVALSRDHDDDESIATGLNNLGHTLDLQGNFPEAEEVLKEAIRLRVKALGDSAPDVAQARLNYAAALRKQGRDEEALPIARAALATYERTPDRNLSDFAKGVQVLGTIEYFRGDYSIAQRTFRRAMDIQESARLGNVPAHARTAMNWASCAMHLGQWGRARTTLLGAEETLRRSRGRLSGDYIGAEINLGDATLGVGDVRRAERYFADAARDYEAARDLSVTGRGEAIDVESPFPKLALVRLRLGDADGAWSAIERYLARDLAEELMRGDASVRLDSLRREVADAARAAEALARAADVRADERLQAQKRLEFAEARWIDAGLEVRRRGAGTTGVATLETVRSALRPDEALVGWLSVTAADNARSDYAYVMRAGGSPQWFPLPAESSRNGVVTAARGALQIPGSPMSSAVVCYRARLAPLMGALQGVRRLVVIPSGDMHGVPIEPLADAGAPSMGERFEVSYVPSATLFAWERGRAAGQPRGGAPRVVCFADPPFSDDALREMSAEGRCGGPSVDLGADRSTTRSFALGDSLRRTASADRRFVSRLPRLRGTRLEIEALRKHADPDSRFLFGERSSEQELVRLARDGELQRAAILHFGTHALVDPRRPERSALVLSQIALPDPVDAAIERRRIFDGLVSAREISSEWRLGADLVTLSACETGLGRFAGGEGYLGLADACLRRGARSVLVSLWEVDDRATSLLMNRFYETLLAKPGGLARKSEALNDAKRWLREYRTSDGQRPYAHPYYWAAFVLVGDAG